MQHTQAHNPKSPPKKGKRKGWRAHRRVVISCERVLFWPCWHGSLQPVQTNYLAIWLMSIKGGQRPNEVQSEAAVDHFASHLWLRSEVPAEKRGARSSVFFGCHPAAHRWPKLHPEVWIWGVLDALMCLGVCVWECGGSELLELLSTLSSSNWILVSVSHFDQLCEFFFVYLFPCWLLKSLDVSNGQTRNFISFEFWYILQIPQRRICHSISKEKSHIVV